MRFDVFSKQEVPTDEPIQTPQGRVQILCTEKACFYISQEGYEVLAAVGHRLDVHLTGRATVRIETPEGVAGRAWMDSPPARAMRTTGEVFTNIDRQPDESGTVQEIQKALRLFKLEQTQLKNELSVAHRKRLNAEKRATERAEAVARPTETPEPERTEADPEGGDDE